MEPRLDCLGNDITETYEPMDTWEWEHLQIIAETTAIRLFSSDEELKDHAVELANGILRMSAEIFRLRLTYGEDVWKSVYHTDEENDIIRKAHESERGKYQINPGA